MSKNKEILELLNNDPHGLLDIKPKTSTSSDEILANSFEEINDFYEQNNREPHQNINDIMEHKLHLRLKGIRSNEEKMISLKPCDRYNLLDVNIKKIESIDDILGDDSSGLLEDEGESLFNLKHVKPIAEREQSDFVARRKPCKNFDEYEHLFKQVHQDIINQKRFIKDFKPAHLNQGNFYLLNGMMLYIKHMEELRESDEFHSGKTFRKDGSKYLRKDGRTLTIFENGTESKMLRSSLMKVLDLNGKSITTNADDVNKSLFDDKIDETDISSGFIYICKSKTQKDEIKSISDLYKIGFSKDVANRIKNAEKDPTFLMQPVNLITYYECYNLNSQKLENLLHKFFSEVCLDIEIFDNNNKKHKPREWFIAPLHVIEKVIELIIDGTIVNYKYDIENKLIVQKD